MSEVRGSVREELPRVRGQWRPGGDTQRLRPVVARRRHTTSEVGAARRSHLKPEARGGDPEEPPRARGQRRRLGGATHARGQGPQPGGATRGAVVAQAQESLEELSHVEGQERWR